MNNSRKPLIFKYKYYKIIGINGNIHYLKFYIHGQNKLYTYLNDSYKIMMAVRILNQF